MGLEAPNPRKFDIEPTPSSRLISSLIQHGDLESVDWPMAIQSLEEPEEQVRAVVLARLAGANLEPLIVALLGLRIHPLSANLFSEIEWRALGKGLDAVRATMVGFGFGSSGMEIESEEWVTGAPSLRILLSGKRPEPPEKLMFGNFSFPYLR